MKRNSLLLVALVVGISSILFAVTPPNYICQQNPNHPACKNSPGGGGGGGSSGSSGACSDSDVQKFLKGQDPFPNPPTGSCPAQIRTYKARQGKCTTAKSCLKHQTDNLKKEIEELKKKIEELKKDHKLVELTKLQQTEKELRNCLANCKTPADLCKDYIALHIDEVLKCGTLLPPRLWLRKDLHSDVCKKVCELCPHQEYRWCLNLGPFEREPSIFRFRDHTESEQEPKEKEEPERNSDGGGNGGPGLPDVGIHVGRVEK